MEIGEGEARVKPYEAYYEAVRLLKEGKVEEAKALMPLMLPSDQKVFERKLEAASTLDD